MGRYRTHLLCALLAASAAHAGVRLDSAQAAATIEVRAGASVAPDARDGRLLLLLSRGGTGEPRIQVSATSRRSTSRSATRTTTT